MLSVDRQKLIRYEYAERFAHGGAGEACDFLLGLTLEALHGVADLREQRRADEELRRRLSRGQKGGF